MAFERVWQYPYELEYPFSNRGQQVDGWGDLFPESSVNPFTGNGSIAKSGSARVYTGATIYPGADDIRGAYAISSNGPGADSANILAFFSSGNGYENDPDLDVIWDKTKLTLSLRIAGVTVDEVSVVQYQWANIFHRNYMHLGFHNIGGSQFVLTINGQEIINYSGGTVPSDIEYVGAFRTTVGWSLYLWIDDFYIETAAGESIEIPPTYRWVYLNTNANGTDQDWASKSGGDDYEEVDDTTIDDDDSYVWIGASGSIEMFNVETLNLLDGHSIVAAIPVAVARKGDAAKDSELQMAIDNGVDAIDYSTAKKLPTWYYETWGRYTLDPAGNPWTESEFNSVEFGMRTQGTV